MKIVKKGSKLYSILFNKCPKCHEGDFMIEKNIFKLHKAFKMHENCSECGFKYMMEPSFFYGAMYVNYGLTVGLAIVTFVISTLVFHLNLLQSFIPIVVILILTAPITIRLSRIIWINLFVSYDVNLSKDVENDQ
ncbi:DUF983 domain-containing protein [Lutibacter sp.]|uniref:DUF983 domain-containing protein n=1 Tax=Lutibacter sp. TaxID=1925666 RepID=UPI00356204A2